MLAAKVALEMGEKARVLLADQGVLARGMEFKAAKDSLLLPVVSRKFKLPFAFKMVSASFKASSKPLPLKELLARAGFSKKQLETLISSFDSIGDIAIIQIPDELLAKKKTIAKALMESNPRFKVVARQTGGLEGEYRTTPLEIIAGEKRTETIYRESGCSFRLDVSKVFFSPRLSFERERIAGLVKPGEKVLALFAGVGPYPIVIAKKQPKAKVAAIELNPDAVKYMRANAAANKVLVEIIEGDVKKTAPAKFRGWADRITMPLPHTGEDFLDAALAAAAKGCIIHFYCFGPVRDEKTRKPLDPAAPAAEKVKAACARNKRNCKILFKRVVRPYAPYVVQSVVDFKVLN
ncbi:MAG: class I SAM-dependent methyltransferase family protein [Candidatus Micrarchaeota archaeon]|nr:class I SAM-dependent methyltransferase family protein [Candidatus Micrarchaeota archaeon]